MISVKLNLMQSNAGFPMAKTAMEEVLDASRIPKVVLVRNSVELKKIFLEAASLEVTGISKPFILFVTMLDAYSSTSQETRISIEAKFNRLQFGADDYYPLVSDLIIIEDR